MPIYLQDHRWLSRYAAFTALATLGLIGLGGLVTSHGAGMAVPDWPTTYGYNMFLFPISGWVGGIFYEHTHRLYASAVGLLTLILAVWIQLRVRDRRMVGLGWCALALVIVQGVLGGLRVEWMKDEIGVVHAALAQVFLVLLAVIALLLSPWWRRWVENPPRVAGEGHVRAWVTTATVLIFLQLLLGATMRHQHAGLAVPDFPLAYGRVWPVVDDAMLNRINALRMDTRDFNPITPFQVQLHMMHRALGIALAALVFTAALRMRRALGPRSAAGRLGALWSGLVLVQMGLGAWTVWSNKAADIATVHVVLGACCLLAGSISIAVCHVAMRHSSAPGRAQASPTGGTLASAQA